MQRGRKGRACNPPAGLTAGLLGLLARRLAGLLFLSFLCFSLVSFCFFPTLVLLSPTIFLFLLVHFMFKYLFVP